MEQRESRRTKMTKRLLKTALLELMQEKPFRQITIKELCERADLNRTTFYLHYVDQKSVLNDIEREVYENTAHYMKNVNPTVESVGFIEAFLLYIQQNDVLFRTLLCNEEGDDFKLAFVKYTLDRIKPNLPQYGDPLRERYVLTFLMYGSIHIIIDWMDSGFDLSAQETAKLLYALCNSVKSIS